MAGFNLANKISSNYLVRHRPPIIIPQIVRERKIKQDGIVAILFPPEATEYITKNLDYVHGKKQCPVCGDMISYSWYKLTGIIEYECSNNNCADVDGLNYHAIILNQDIRKADLLVVKGT